MLSLFQLSKLTPGQYSSLESLFDLPLRCANTQPYTPIKHQVSSIKSQTKYKEFVVSGEYETMQKFTNKNIKAKKHVKNLSKISSVSRSQIKRKLRKRAQISTVKANRSVFANSLTEQDTYHVQTLYSKFWVPLILKRPVDI